MKISYTKRFEKHYKKLSQKFKDKTLFAIGKFSKNPRDPVLYNHALQGKLEGFRSISVTGDIRIIFREYDEYVLVVMIDIGTHSQLY